MFIFENVVFCVVFCCCLRAVCVVLCCFCCCFCVCCVLLLFPVAFCVDMPRPYFLNVVVGAVTLPISEKNFETFLVRGRFGAILLDILVLFWYIKCEMGSGNAFREIATASYLGVVAFLMLCFGTLFSFWWRKCLTRVR